MMLPKETCTLAATTGDSRVVTETVTRPEISGTTSGRPQHGRGKPFRRLEAQEVVSYRGSQHMNLSKHSSTKRYLVLMLVKK